MQDWVKNFCGAVTICDRDLNIVFMNDKAATTFADSGGQALVGQPLLNCHNERSRTRINEIIAADQPNAYTVQKKGVKKLIYQAPMHDENGAFAGLVELSLVIPAQLPHFDRDKSE